MRFHCNSDCNESKLHRSWGLQFTPSLQSAVHSLSFSLTGTITLFYFQLKLNPYMSVKLHIDTFVEQELADEKATVVII